MVGKFNQSIRHAPAQTMLCYSYQCLGEQESRVWGFGVKHDHQIMAREGEEWGGGNYLGIICPFVLLFFSSFFISDRKCIGYLFLYIKLPSKFNSLKTIHTQYIIVSLGLEPRHGLTGSSSSEPLTVIKVLAQVYCLTWTSSHSVDLIEFPVGYRTESLSSSLAFGQRLLSVLCQVALSIKASM